MSRPLALGRRPFLDDSAADLSTLRRNVRNRALLTLWTGSVATAALALLSLVNAGGAGGVYEDILAVFSAISASLALLMMTRRPGTAGLRYGSLAAAVAVTALAMATLDLVPLLSQSTAAAIASACFAAGSAITMVVILPTLFRHLDRRTRLSAAVDATIMLLASTTVLLTLWHAHVVGSTATESLLLPLLAAALAASTFVAAIAAIAMRAVPKNRGLWFGLPGVALLSLSWIVWVDLLLYGQNRSLAVSLLFSAGILLATYGWLSWDEEIAKARRVESAAQCFTDWAPMIAILCCVSVGAIPHGQIMGFDPAPVGTALVALLSVGRQRMLVVRERWASGRLAGEMDERAQTTLSLSQLERAETLERTAARICGQALLLDGIQTAGIYAFNQTGAAVPLALAGEFRYEDVVNEPLDAQRSLHIRTHADGGAWIDTPGPDAQTRVGPLLGEAFAPMHWENRIVGVVSMGTTGRADAERLSGRLSTLTEFGVVSAALMGPSLVELWRQAEIRSQLESIISDRAFMPVFQAVVRLRNREIVGFEALTRFHDGTLPDRRFEDAERAGMSVRLETACIHEQLEAATWLPPGTWVSLNVSPALAGAIVPLISALKRTDRDVVIEITEHVEVTDYRTLVDALDLVRGRARLAVDDAGAGYAGLRHILELRPQFVKLDISLVRHIDTDAARQAMVAGMAHFASNAGCELIAEGIETEQEVTELIRLGVPLGQGYLFGKPAPLPAN
jgi:EAL domain-containing protein (putative c-di-GMP-specific phosphodiesterase class I)